MLWFRLRCWDERGVVGRRAKLASCRLPLSSAAQIGILVSGCEDEVVFDEVEGGGHAGGGDGLGLVYPVEFCHEALFDAEDGVGMDVFIVGVEDVGGERCKAVSSDDVVQMRRAVRMAPQGLQHLPHRAIGRYGVILGLDAAKPVGAVAAGAEDAAQVKFGLDALLLNVVKAFVVGLPDVDLGGIYGITFYVEDAAAHEHGLAFLVEADVGTHCQLRRAVDMKGTEHGRLRGARRLAVVDGVDQHRYPQHIGEQDKFLAPVVALVTGGSEELDGLQPFFLTRFELFDRRVQVLNEHADDLPQARVGVGGDAADDDFGGVSLGEVALFLRVHC